MAVKEYKPTTPARRGMSSQDFDSITTKKPLKSLVRAKKSIAGRNNQGRITTRHQGGGVRKFYRVVNFKLSVGTSATVEQIEYDPNRSARIARIKDQNGAYHYVLASRNMKPGRKFKVDEETSIEQGNRLPLKNIPTGTQIHAIELQSGRGAQLVRTAGSSAQLIAKDEKYAQIRLPSGEIRMINAECMATVGVIGNEQHQNIKIGKAGRKRRMGVRPTVRGVVMNAADHPHGGGDGGRHKMARPPTTPWGQKTLGYKTRRRKTSNKFIIRTRHQGKRR
jgi:large subunit ribosomal protein L2